GSPAAPAPAGLPAIQPLPSAFLLPPWSSPRPRRHPRPHQSSRVSLPFNRRQGPSCPRNLGQDRRARRAKFGTALPCRVATLGKGREASGARPQPETVRERTQTYVTEPDTARTKRRAACCPAPLLSCQLMPNDTLP